MPCYDVHKSLELFKCKTHNHRVRGSDSRVGPIWPYSKNVNFSLLQHRFEKKLNVLL